MICSTLIICLIVCALMIHGGNSVFMHKCVRIGVDYGPRLIGIAYSDFFGVVHPYTTIRNTGNLTQISESISNFALSLRAREVILGVPLDGNGLLDYDVKNMNGKICLNFSFVLACIVKKICPSSVKVRLYDERYSTQEAKLKQLHSKKKATLDAVAAQCILERYLEEEGDMSIEAIPCQFPPPDEIAEFNYDLIRQYIRMQHRAENHKDWSNVMSYVENYKVYSPLLHPSLLETIELQESSSSTNDEKQKLKNIEPTDNNTGRIDDANGDENDDEDDDELLQREILARRRPVGMSKARWKQRMLNAAHTGISSNSEIN